MAVAITATTQDTPPRVLVSVTGLTIGDSIELFRVIGTDRTAVRAAADDSVADTSFVRTDAEQPFGVAVSYVAVVNASTEYATSATVYTLPGGKPVVTDAISGNAVSVTVLRAVDPQHSRRASVFEVGGRNVVVSGDWGMYSGDLDLITETDDDRDDLDGLLIHATEGVVQIRQPGGYDGIDAYLAVLGSTMRRMSPRSGTDPRRIFTLTVAEVEGWAPGLEAQGFTLQDIANVYDVNGPELVPNGLFETDVAGWTALNASIVRSTAQKHEGLASMLITPNGTSASGGANTSVTLPVTGGRPYRMSLWAYSGTGWSDLGPAVDWNGPGGFLSSSNGGAAVPAATWTLRSVDAVAPATAINAVMRARHANTPAAVNTWHADQVSLVQLGSLLDIADDYATLLAIAQGSF